MEEMKLSEFGLPHPKRVNQIANAYGQSVNDRLFTTSTILGFTIYNLELKECNVQECGVIRGHHPACGVYNETINYLMVLKAPCIKKTAGNKFTKKEMKEKVKSPVRSLPPRKLKFTGRSAEEVKHPRAGVCKECKKSANYIAGGLCSDCGFKPFLKAVDEGKVEELLLRGLNPQEQPKVNCSHDVCVTVGYCPNIGIIKKVEKSKEIDPKHLEVEPKDHSPPRDEDWYYPLRKCMGCSIETYSRDVCYNCWISGVDGLPEEIDPDEEPLAQRISKRKELVSKKAGLPAPGSPLRKDPPYDPEFTPSYVPKPEPEPESGSDTEPEQEQEPEYNYAYTEAERGNLEANVEVEAEISMETAMKLINKDYPESDAAKANKAKKKAQRKKNPFMAAHTRKRKPKLTKKKEHKKREIKKKAEARKVDEVKLTALRKCGALM